jgi:glycosyltransferase involved in cell wall biosynthesis
MLSIIIPTLNEEEFLPLLLDQIKKQDFNDYEIIVADGGSQDKTNEIAKKFNCRIVQGGSPARGRNQGAKAAKGDVFLFMDADNFFLPDNFLKDVLQFFKEKKIGSACFPIYPKGNKIDLIIYAIYSYFVYLTQIPFAFNSVLVRKDVFNKVNGFDEEIKIAEDHYFIKQAAKVDKFRFIKTKPVLTSARRFERDGRLKTYSKYILVGFYWLFFGPVKKDIFNYKFNHYLSKNK